MRKRILIIAVSLVMVLSAVSSCGPAGETVQSTLTNTVIRWHDDEKNVTCWIYTNSSAGAGGISCLPDGQIE